MEDNDFRQLLKGLTCKVVLKYQLKGDKNSELKEKIFDTGDTVNNYDLAEEYLDEFRIKGILKYSSITI